MPFALAYVNSGFACYFILHLLISDHHGNYHVDRMFSSELGLIDWAFLQMILFAFVMLGLMNRYDTLVTRPVRLLGDASFSIYFLHAYVVYVFRVVTRWHNFQGGLLKWVLLTAGTIAVCIAVTKLVQRLFGRYSRMVIGS